jgi:hypothetical protein
MCVKHLDYPIEICTNCLVTGRVQRRALFQLAAASTLSLLAATNARANVPIPEPLTLAERIKYARWIFTGQFRRVVYLSPNVVEKLFTPGEIIHPYEFKLYERHEPIEPRTAFLEIENARPILQEPDIRVQESSSIAVGTIYVYSGPTLDPEYRAAVSSFEGKNVILFIDGQEKQFGVNGTLFPKPLYRPSSSGGNWRSGLPLPSRYLPDVMGLGLSFGLVKSSRSKR